jgi:DNA polymerase-3 subunit delta'
LALRFAQALNCTNDLEPGIPCGACRNCVQLIRVQHPDLDVVQAEQEGGILKVKQIRELLHRLSLSPYQARYRVGLLLRFEEANPSAANALLKTLEEPPPKVVLLLTAESPERLLPTIPSRCEVLRLRPVPADTIEEGLVSRWGIPPEQAHLLAHLANGRPGYALRLHEQPEQLKQRRCWLDDLLSLLSADRVRRFAYAEQLSKDKQQFRQALLVWLSFWRDVMLFNLGVPTEPVNLDRSGEIEQLASELHLEVVKRAVVALERTLDLIEKNINPKLAAEVLLLDWPRAMG